MGIIEELQSAIRTYPETHVQLEVVEVDVPQTELNVNEIATFRVRASNTGPLPVTGMTLKVHGQNGATVANNGAAAPFVSEFITQELPTLRAHNGSELTVGSPLKFKAPGLPQDAKTLVKVTLEDWNLDLDHIFDAHTDPLDTVKAVYNDDVIAN